MACGPYLAHHLYLSIKFFWNTTTPIHLFIFKDCFYALMADVE